MNYFSLGNYWWSGAASDLTQLYTDRNMSSAIYDAIFAGKEKDTFPALLIPKVRIMNCLSVLRNCFEKASDVILLAEA
jgi:hypothetical protein